MSANHRTRMPSNGIRSAMFIEPVARFRSPFKTKFGIPRQAGLIPELKGKIVFEPGFRSFDAVRGLEGFDYIWLIWGFSGNKPRSVAEPVEATEPIVPVAEPAEASGALRQAQRPKTPFQATVRPPRLGGKESLQAAPLSGRTGLGCLPSESNLLNMTLKMRQENSLGQ